LVLQDVCPEHDYDPTDHISEDATDRAAAQVKVALGVHGGRYGDVSYGYRVHATSGYFYDEWYRRYRITA
jgi:hypothetical protein